VLVTYAWGKRAAGPRAAFAGALMLCLFPRYAQMARMVSMNSLLTLWGVAAVAVRTGRTAWAAQARRLKLRRLALRRETAARGRRG
jgi:hypothetical protein